MQKILAEKDEHVAELKGLTKREDLLRLANNDTHPDYVLIWYR